ncbi:TPA: hypothetical protein QDZ23_000892 [Pseudomonas putida]|uniref:hypothetical protein n=1 Tax=Pseudomonas paracarnis TaxID=2750625 RepID=UPI002D797375|nr:hypothetical protein [Pseudomonas paracarnis]HDS0926277.1 hypothetical protein [Pseudomonas putida]
MKKLATLFTSFTITGLGIYTMSYFAIYFKELLNQTQANPTGPHIIILIALFTFALHAYATAFLLAQLITKNQQV